MRGHHFPDMELCGDSAVGVAAPPFCTRIPVFGSYSTAAAGDQLAGFGCPPAGMGYQQHPSFENQSKPQQFGHDQQVVNVPWPKEPAVNRELPTWEIHDEKPPKVSSIEVT